MAPGTDPPPVEEPVVDDAVVDEPVPDDAPPHPAVTARPSMRRTAARFTPIGRRRHPLGSRILVKAAARLAPKPARLDIRAQERARPVLVVPQPLVQHLHD